MDQAQRKEWLEWRRGGIGGSDAAVVMGVSPWRTLYQLYEEKALNIINETDTLAMKRGREQEEEARLAFEDMVGVHVFKKDKVVHESIPFIRGSLDGLSMDEEVLVELKNPGAEDHAIAKRNNVPEKYFPQCQHYLLLYPKLKSMFYFSRHKGNNALVEVKRDGKYIDEMLTKEIEFWNMVTNRIPPERGDPKYLDMNAHVEWEKLTQDWLNAKEMAAEWEFLEKKHRQKLIMLAGERSAEGAGVRLIKSECKGAIDYDTAINDYLDNMRVHYPDVDFPKVALEPYRKDSFTKYSLKVI